MKQVAAFVGERGFLKQDFPGAPEAFQGGPALSPERSVPGGGEPGLVACGEQRVEGAVLVQHGETFGFGRMCGEHGFDLDVGKRGGNGFAGEPELEEGGELVSPETAFGGWPLLVLAEGADCCGGVFLNHVEELESDGIHQTKLGRQLVDFGGSGFLGGPREMGGEVVAAKVLEDVAQAIDKELKVGVDLLEAELEVIGGNGAGGGVIHAGAFMCFFE